MKKLVLVFLVLFVSTFAIANGEHADKEFITGSGFDLVHVNHILVGTYNLIPVWAEKICGSHIKGQIKLGKEIKEFVVKKIDGKLTAKFPGRTFKFSGFDKENKTIYISDDEYGREIAIRYDMQDVEDVHLVKVSFNADAVTGINPDDVRSFDVFLDGECCYGSLIYYALFLTGLVAM